MQRIVWLGGEIRNLDGVLLRGALADHGVAHAHGQTADRAHQIFVHAVGGGDPEVARLCLGDVNGAAAGIRERAGVRQDAREHGLELERRIDRPADLAERLQLAHRARQLLGPLLDLAFEVGVGLLKLPSHEIELLGERLQLVAGLDIDAARQIAPADAGRALLQGPDRARQTAHVPPGESHEQQQGQTADRDTGDDRPVVDLALPVDRSLKLLAQLDRERIQRFRQGRPKPCR